MLLARIVRRWERRIFALAYGMLGREETRVMLRRKTFLAAFRNIRGFRGKQSFILAASDRRKPMHYQAAKARSETKLRLMTKRRKTRPALHAAGDCAVARGRRPRENRRSGARLTVYRPSCVR